MADFFGFNSTATFHDSLHDDPGDTLEEDTDDYDALNDETFGGDVLAGTDWEEAHEALAQLDCRVSQESDELPLDDLELEASISQLVDDYEDTATEKPRNKIKAGVIEMGYSCSPPSEFNVWAVNKQDQQSLPTPKKIHTLEELERGLKSQSRPAISRPENSGVHVNRPEVPNLLIGRPDPPNVLIGRPELPNVLIGPPRPPAALRLEDVERDLTNKNKVPAGFNRVHNQFHQMNVQEMIMQRNMHNGLRGPPMALRGPRGFPVPGMMPGDFPHHQHMLQQRYFASHPHLLRFLPPQYSQHMMPTHPHMRNNNAFRPPYQMCGPGIRHPMMRGPMMRGPHQGPGPQVRGPHDYEGLMSDREIQWLLNIQLMQLNTLDPYQDDYYYTVYQSRKKNNTSDSRNGRERRDSQSQTGLQARSYTPLQFENSLGRLQVGSVTAPRKIMDMEVVSETAASSTGNTSQRESLRIKQLLLQLEQLYLLLLELQEPDKPSANADSTVSHKAGLVSKIMTTLMADSKLQSALCVRKGKTLVLRLFPHINLHGSRQHISDIYATLFRNLVTIARRDADCGVLPAFVEPLACYLRDATQEEVTDMVGTFRVNTATRNVLQFAITTKFGVSALALLLDRGAELDVPVPPSDWSTFAADLAEAASYVGLDGAATPLVDAGLKGAELLSKLLPQDKLHPLVDILKTRN